MDELFLFCAFGLGLLAGLLLALFIASSVKDVAALWK